MSLTQEDIASGDRKSERHNVAVISQEDIAKRIDPQHNFEMKNHLSLDITTLAGFYVFYVYMEGKEQKPTVPNLTVVEPVPNWYHLPIKKDLFKDRSKTIDIIMVFKAISV